MRYFIKFWVPVILWAGLIFQLSSYQDKDIPAQVLKLIGQTAEKVNQVAGLPGRRITPGMVRESVDFSVHILEYSVLALLTVRALNHGILPVPTLKRMCAGIVASNGYGMLDEFHQTFVPTRHFAWIDMAGNLIGSLLGGLFFYNTLARRLSGSICLKRRRSATRCE